MSLFSIVFPIQLESQRCSTAEVNAAAIPKRCFRLRRISRLVIGLGFLKRRESRLMVSLGAAEIVGLGAVRIWKRKLVFGTGMQQRSVDVPWPFNFRIAHNSTNDTGGIDRGIGSEEACGIGDEAAVVRIRLATSECPTGACLPDEDARVRSLLDSAPLKLRNLTIRRLFDLAGIKLAKGSVRVDGDSDGNCDGNGVGGVGD
jgi:hypothetical protein